MRYVTATAAGLVFGLFLGSALVLVTITQQCAQDGIEACYIAKELPRP